MDENKSGFVYSGICVSWDWQHAVLVAEGVHDGLSLLRLLFVHVCMCIRSACCELTHWGTKPFSQKKREQTGKGRKKWLKCFPYIMLTGRISTGKGLVLPLWSTQHICDIVLFFALHSLLSKGQALFQLRHGVSGFRVGREQYKQNRLGDWCHTWH